jgi:hypothetical protein
LTYLFSFHTLAHSFVSVKNSTLLFSIDSELFCQNTRGGGTPIFFYEDQNENTKC